MKKINKQHQDESTLLQEIIRTYRYPDGTLNGIAVFISTLALILLLLLGHFTIAGIKSLRGMNSVSASELTLKEIEEYITDTYLDAASEYSDKRVDHDTAKRKILKHISEYLTSSDAFTDDQKKEILDSISSYLESINFEESINENSEAIKEINSTFEKYVDENAATLTLLRDSLQAEIDSNQAYTNSELDALRRLQDTLSNLELTHYNSIHNHIAETITRLDKSNESFLKRLYDGIVEWSENGNYPINSYVIYNNDLYKNITGSSSSTSPDLDTTNWTKASITSVINNHYNTFLTVSGATEYDPSRTYQAGEYVIFNNTIYKNVSGNGTGSSTGVTPGTDDNVWQATSLTEMIDKNYKTFISVTGASDYNPSSSYQPGDYVIYNGSLYRNLDGTSTSPSSTGWEQLTITNLIDVLRQDLEALGIKSSADLTDLQNNLTEIINNNKSLSDEQQKQALELIAATSDASKEGLENLQNELLTIINSNASKNESEREKLVAELNALTSNTASKITDIEKGITDLSNNTASQIGDLEKRIKALEDKSSATKAPTTNEQAFDFGISNGIYGYWIEGTFYPF